MITHGMSRTPTYKAWDSMLQRCNNPHSQAYSSYGGRGIMVCERWQTFETFLDDMGERPEGLTLDRLDNNAGYTPENCMWSTRKVQQNNRRNSVRVSTTQGFLTVLEFANLIGKSRRAVEHILRHQYTKISNCYQKKEKAK